jgi:hypothetical protein
MTLRLSIAALQAALALPPERKDAWWAYDVCALTRQVHLYVWQEIPDNMLVSQQILSLFATAQQQVRDVPKQDSPLSEYTGHFAHNIGRRIANLGNYIANRPSDFPPDSVIDDPVNAERELTSDRES